ncbi:MAG: transcription elongation factor GreA [Armatimonadaceae bacterium]
MQLMEQQDELILLTRAGKKSIEEELERLVTVERHEVANRIRDAKDYGDLSENAEYESAKNAQAFIEGRILDLKRILSSARTLEETEVPTDKVGLGSVVTVRDLDFGDDWTMTMVSPYEADPEKDRISDHSPIGKSLIGKKVGDVVTVKTPGGNSSYEIIAITK